MSHDTKNQVNKHISIRDKFYIPFLILRLIVHYWYTYIRLQLGGLVIVLIVGIFTGTLFTKAGLYCGSAITALYLGLYFLHHWFERHDG